MNNNYLYSEKLSFLEYIFCILIVLSSGTLLSTDYSYTLYAIIAIFIFMIAKKEIVIVSGFAKVISFILLFLLLSIVQNLVYSGGKSIDVVIKNFAIIICMVLFAISRPSHNLQRISFLVKVILLFSVVSNCLYLYNILGPGLALQTSAVTETPHYYYLYTSAFNTIEIGNAFRNGGIYWEPGMYQVYLAFALLYCLYKSNFKWRFLIVLYIVLSIISTFSVSGYAVTVAIFGVYILKNNYSPIIKGLIAIVVIIAFMYVYPILDASMEAKQETGSYEARSNDLLFGLRVYLNHPIIGCGIVNEEYAKASKIILHVDRASSNGMINLLINTGIIGFSIVTCYLVLFAKWAKKNISSFVMVGLGAWLIISTNTEPIVFHPFFEFLVGIGIAQSLYNKRPISVSERSAQ